MKRPINGESMDGKNQRITVASEARAEIEEKRSVFIGSIAPVSTEEEARAFIDRVKKEYYDARHNVFAYVLQGGAVSRFTDDGEPKGSAGIPVLNVLKMNGIDGACVVVTRYFGGILLGTGGLVRAYSAAAKAALDAAGTAFMTEYAVCEAACSYQDYSKIAPKLAALGALEEGSSFEGSVTLRLSCLPEDVPAVNDHIVQTTCGKSSLRVLYTEERPRR